MDELNDYWSDASCPSKSGLGRWEKVWCTYGTCSNLTESEYFKRALALRAQANLLSILKRNGKHLSLSTRARAHPPLIPVELPVLGPPSCFLNCVSFATYI